jgi:hypothetical protein
VPLHYNLEYPACATPHTIQDKFHFGGVALYGILILVAHLHRHISEYSDVSLAAGGRGDVDASVAIAQELLLHKSRDLSSPFLVPQFPI